MSTTFVPAVRPAGSLHAERRWALIVAYVSLTLAAIVMLAPPFYMLITSLKGSAEIADLSGNPWLLRNPTLENYAAIIGSEMFRGFFWNSIKVTVMVVIITMIVSVLAAFALARMKFWGSEYLATGVFLTYLVPDTLLFLPLYQIVGGLGLLDVGRRHEVVGVGSGRRGLSHWMFTPSMMTSEVGVMPSASTPPSAIACTTSRPDVIRPNTV